MVFITVKKVHLNWLMALGLSNMMVPLFFPGRLEAQVMLGATILSFGLGVVLFKIQGMTKLLGLMHAPWIAPAYLIIRKFPSKEGRSFSNRHFRVGSIPALSS